MIDFTTFALLFSKAIYFPPLEFCVFLFESYDWFEGLCMSRYLILDELDCAIESTYLTHIEFSFDALGEKLVTCLSE